MIMINDKLSDMQHGFRKNRSCETAIIRFTQDIYNSIEKPNGKVVAVYIDCSKAFDAISHDLLILKLIIKFNVEPYRGPETERMRVLLVL